MKPAEIDEQERLADVTDRLRRALQTIEGRLKRYARDIQDQKTYLWESKSDMDHVEKVFTRGVIQQAVMTGETVAAQGERLRKLLRSPYFGRVDFRQERSGEAEAIYIGVHHFSETGEQRPLVHDWRAPVSTMFYDHETGPAAYDSPGGEVRGEMLLKRQFRIRDGRMELMLENSEAHRSEVIRRVSRDVGRVRRARRARVRASGGRLAGPPAGAGLVLRRDVPQKPRAGADGACGQNRGGNRAEHRDPLQPRPQHGRASRMSSR